MSMTAVKKISLYNIPLILTMGIFIYNHIFYSVLVSEAPVEIIMDDHQKSALQMLSTMTELLISLATALFAVVLYFVFEYVKLDKPIPGSLRLELVLCLCSCAVSLDFGYVFYDKISELLSLKIFDLEEPTIVFPKKMQMLFFVISLFFAGRLIIKTSFRNE